MSPLHLSSAMFHGLFQAHPLRKGLKTFVFKNNDNKYTIYVFICNARTTFNPIF